jgi:uncharacterized protein YutE (UPF0331/DUF86 family)
MVDRERILEKIDLAERWAERVETYRPATLESYLDEDIPRAATERALQVTIEALVDAASLFVSGLRLGIPASEATMIDTLEDEVLSAEEAALLDDLRGFRNVLVHQYGDLEDERVFELAVKLPGDARTLTEAYRAALDRKADET